ncbi:MAG: ABC transporter substrate-binding protein [Betaproteobacteria bacterium]|nr:ABC transporter substrate-binding protein [Betaproteobacteria bacterium]
MAQLKILGAGPVKRGITRIAADFGKASGHEVTVEFTGAPTVRERVLAGEVVDIAVVPSATMDEFAAAGRVAPATRSTLGRARMGLAVRKGAVRLDLSSTDAFRRAVRQADAVVANLANSGNYVAKLLEQQGFAADKVRRQPDAVKVMDLVAGSPEKLLGAGQLPEIRELIDKGVAIELAGPLPDALQSITAYEAAATVAGGGGEAVDAFIAYLATPQARAAMAASGID